MASERFQLACPEPSSLGNTLGAGALVDVLLLRTVDAYKRFDGFDDVSPCLDQALSSSAPDDGFGVRIVEGVRDLAQTIETGFEPLVILPEILRSGYGHLAGCVPLRAAGPQSIEDDGEIPWPLVSALRC